MKVLRELLKIFMAVGVCSTVSKLLASKSSHHSWKHAWLKGAMDNGFYEQPLQLRTAILLPNSHHTFVKLDLWAIRSFFSVTSYRDQQNRDIAGGKNPISWSFFLYFVGFFIWVRIFYSNFKTNSHGKMCNRTGNFTSWEAVAKEQIVMENLCSLTCSSNDSSSTCVAELCACTPMLYQCFIFI